MNSVARGDGATAGSSPLTRYYAESGTPPGRWLGAGLAGLNNGNGLAIGSEVTEEGLWRLLGMLADPATGEALGRRPRRWPDPLSQRIADRVSALPASLSNIARAAAATRIEIEEKAREHSLGRPVAAFDLTFSVPKSVSTVWALGDAHTQAAIHAAHHDAIGIALAWAEDNVLFSRTGHNGAIQEPVRGAVAAAFDHWDSRAGDPHLHTHVVIANRVQTLDGLWRTLDSKTLHRYVVAISELHEGVVQDLLTERLGYAWRERSRRHSPVPRHDIDGVPARLMERFSQRSTQISAAKEDLVAAFAAAHGRHPSAAEVLRLRQQATLETRPDKQRLSLAELCDDWRERARDVTGDDQARWAEQLRNRSAVQAVAASTIREEMLTQLAHLALATVAEKRATFRHANVLAEVHRQLHGVHFTSPTDRLGVAERTTALALNSALQLNPDDPLQPDFRVHRGAEVFTTRETLDAETRLLDAGRGSGAPGVPCELISDAAAAGDRKLSEDQASAVSTIATSGRVLDLLVGPAGTGKTTTLAVLRTGWERQHGSGSVIGLAPSAAAADVLADSLSIDTENTAKWLIETARTPERDARLQDVKSEIARCSSLGSVRARRLTTEMQSLRSERERWVMHAGQLVIIDEASLAGTASLDRLTAQASTAGAKLLLVGDPAQLSPIDAGGAFTMLCHDRTDLPELTHAHRFTHAWEREASLRLRAGDPTVIATYNVHGRIQSGDHRTMLGAVYDAWADDTARGLTSLMIAPDRDAVTALNHRARGARIRSGEVTAHGVPTADGAAAVGDHVITRRNDRTLRTPSGWVKNGDAWTVIAANADGSMVVTDGAGSRVGLPPGYVANHVELGYAATAHRVQGRTVDTSHSLVNRASNREALYVAATRGRDRNIVYVAADYDADPDTAHEPDDLTSASEVLRAVLEHTNADTSAHTAMKLMARESLQAERIDPPLTPAPATPWVQPEATIQI